MKHWEKADKIISENLKIYDLVRGDEKLRIAFTRRLTNKKTEVKCRENSVFFEKKIMGFPPIKETFSVVQVSSLVTKDTLSLLVISGHPGMISGLDDGAFGSVKTVLSEKNHEKLYVMSMRAFKKIKNVL